MKYKKNLMNQFNYQIIYWTFRKIEWKKVNYLLN